VPAFHEEEAQLTESAHGGLYFEIRELANTLDRLTARGMAGIFGVCGRALAPLLKQVERRSEGRWAVPDLALALDSIEAFATGLAEAANHDDLRARLMVAISGEHPWSTYAQDVLICADAGLAAASVDSRPKPISIQYALEPLMAFMQNRDAGTIRIYGDNHWSKEIIKDPAMAKALGFLRSLIEEVSEAALADSRQFDRLVSEAAVLRPVNR